MAFVKFLTGFIFLLGIVQSSDATAFGSDEAKAEKNQPRSKSEILVIGPKKRRQRAENFIKANVAPVANDQFARYVRPICPRVLGLSGESNLAVQSRMLKVAEAAEIRTKSGKCKANMTVLFVHNPKQVLQNIRKKNHTWFEEMSVPDRERLAEKDGPTYAWHDLETRSWLGNRAGSLSSSLVVHSSVPGMDPPPESTAAYGFGASNSRYTKSLRQDLNMTVLLIDIKNTENLELVQLADYALMRLAANTSDRKAGESPEETILTLFSDREKGLASPRSVTQWDFTLLKALYKTRPYLPAARQRNEMSGVFEKELAGTRENEGKTSNQ